MPILKASKRGERTNKRREAVNKPIKTKVKRLVSRTYKLIEAGNKVLAEQTYKEMSSTVDRAAKKGVIHSKKADRHKSRLKKQLSGLKETSSKAGSTKTSPKKASTKKTATTKAKKQAK